MGQLVMVIGKSGSGKSTSLRNFVPGTVGVLNVAGKRLPFRTDLKPANKPDYKTCIATLQANNLNAYVIDDSTYLMQFDNFARCKQKGYDKFTEMALAFEQLLETAIATSDDTIVYFLHHPQFSDDGSAKPQTIGKMLDSQLCIEGLFPIVIECVNGESGHRFITNNNGQNIAKSPMDMLPMDMDNDLAAVDTMIREYWGLKQIEDNNKKNKLQEVK